MGLKALGLVECPKCDGAGVTFTKSGKKKKCPDCKGRSIVKAAAEPTGD